MCGKTTVHGGAVRETSSPAHTPKSTAARLPGPGNGPGSRTGRAGFPGACTSHRPRRNGPCPLQASPRALHTGSTAPSRTSSAFRTPPPETEPDHRSDRCRRPALNPVSHRPREPLLPAPRPSHGRRPRARTRPRSPVAAPLRTPSAISSAGPPSVASWSPSSSSGTAPRWPAPPAPPWGSRPSPPPAAPCCAAPSGTPHRRPWRHCGPTGPVPRTRPRNPADLSGPGPARRGARPPTRAPAGRLTPERPRGRTGAVAGTAEIRRSTDRFPRTRPHVFGQLPGHAHTPLTDPPQPVRPAPKGSGEARAPYGDRPPGRGALPCTAHECNAS